MTLHPMKTLMADAHAGGYAVPAFNCANLEMIQCVLRTAAELRAPVILGIHPVEIAYMGSASIAVAISISPSTRTMAIRSRPASGRSGAASPA